MIGLGHLFVNQHALDRTVCWYLFPILSGIDYSYLVCSKHSDIKGNTSCLRLTLRIWWLGRESSVINWWSQQDLVVNLLYLSGDRPRSFLVIMMIAPEPIIHDWSRFAWNQMSQAQTAWSKSGIVHSPQCLKGWSVALKCSPMTRESQGKALG